MRTVPSRRRVTEEVNVITVSLTGRVIRAPELNRVERSDGTQEDVCEVRVATRDGRGRLNYIDCLQWGAGGPGARAPRAAVGDDTWAARRGVLSRRPEPGRLSRVGAPLSAGASARRRRRVPVHCGTDA